MEYLIYHTATFDTKLKKYSLDFQDWLDHIEDQLILQPYVGDPIRVPWFREKKKGKIRVYYLIYESLGIVYLVDISEKKDQQKIINTIWALLDGFYEEVEGFKKNSI